MGPLLFLLYINDLKYVSKNKNCKIILYADDTNIFIASETLDKACESANNILSHIIEYMLFNLLHINLDKSCFMYFPPKRKFLKPTHVNEKFSSAGSKNANKIVEKTNALIYIGKNAVKEVTKVRFLGVIFDPLLDWSAHIHYFKKIENILCYHKAHIIIYTIYELQKYLSHTFRLTPYILYFNMGRS